MLYDFENMPREEIKELFIDIHEKNIALGKEISGLKSDNKALRGVLNDTNFIED